MTEKRTLRKIFTRKRGYKYHPPLWTDAHQKRYEKTIREFNELLEEARALTSEKSK